MNNNYNYNNQPVNNMNPNMNYSQPMNNQMNMNQGYNQQPMNQPTSYNMNYGYIQPKQPFKFPALAKDLPSILGYIGAIIVMIGSLLTFATLKVKLNGESILDESVNYFITDGRVKDGMFIFLLAIVAVGLIHFRKNLLSLIPTGIASILVIFDVVDANSRIEDLNKIYESYGSWLEYKVDAGFGPAPFIVAVGIILLIVHAVLYIVNKKKANRPPVNNMYNGMNYNQPVNNMNQNMNYNQPMNNQMNMNQGYSQQPMNQYPNNNM
jgi:NADH:ubiquinone oxidoreductase subunit 6 (subunit J)